MKRFARLPSPAMVVAVTALFVALGGVSYGFATGSIDSRELKNNSVLSKDIRNNTVRSLDLRNNEVRGRDIRNSTIQSSDIGTNQVKGVDLDESTLGEVPKATGALSAGSLSSQDKINYQAATGTGAKQIYKRGGLTLSASCGASAATVTATTSVSNATIQSSGPGDVTDFDTGDSATLTSADGEFNVVYSEPAGQVVVIQYAAVGGGVYGGSTGCAVKGVGQTL